MKYAVTGSTGGLGSLSIKHLVAAGVSPASIVALARSAAKAEALEKMGVTVRIADYDDVGSLEKALSGVDRLLLVSGNAIGQRFPQHSNVLKAAETAGVKRIAYTSLIAADTSTNPLAGEHKATEAAIRASGLEYVILRNNWYTENFLGDVAGARQTGTIIAAVKTGKVASALKAEYAEAAIKALMDDRWVGKTLELAGKAWSYSELAKAVSAVIGKPVAFKTVSEAEKKAALLQAGLPEGGAAFYALLDLSIEAGTLDHTSGDLETLLGRKPLELEEALRSLTA
jgi:NAD(P)H dehydrogenase (quinone)